jgi:lysophospholipase L1-like esterase
MEVTLVRHRRRRSLCAPESLENRLVMSHVGLTALPDVHAAPEHHSLTSAHVGGAATIGAVGDSLTDPYQGYPPDRSHARNWVELLASSHHASFGAFSRNVHGQSGHPGYANDWAMSGATSSQLVANQLPSLASQVSKGQVKYAVVLIGDNDFGQFLTQAPALASNPGTLVATLAEVERTAQANFDTIVQTLLQANPNVKLEVVTIPDIAQSPVVQSELAPLGADGRDLAELVSQAIGTYNQHIRSVAGGESRIALADLAAVDTSLAQSTSPLRVGSVTMNMTQIGDDYHDFILADGLHPGTIAQGIIANTMVSVLDAKFDAGIRPLSGSQIVTIARQADVASPTSARLKH